jgi:twitching motility protein PilT
LIDIINLLGLAQMKNASDLHLAVDSLPLIRVNGLLEAISDNAPLTENEVQEALLQLARPAEVEKFRRSLELDFSRTLNNGTRLRCSVAQQRGVISLTIRILTAQLPDIDQLELPVICKKLALIDRGLIIISGPTGSGKTTTQAAMIKYINDHQTRHILTFEDPIEYSFHNIKSKITQRELGRDTLSLPEALKHALRHDPDVIVIGEMRDTETAAAVLSLAETGHLVISTSHAPYAANTVERVIDLFPPEERFMAQMRLASLLTAILCQTLVPRADGMGRIAAVEILLVNSAIRNLIREGKLTLLANSVRDYRQNGNTTLDEALVSLYRDGIITLDTVKAYCHDMENVNRLLTNIIVRTKTLSANSSIKSNSR